MSDLSHKWLIGVKLVEGRGKFVSARQIICDPPSPPMTRRLSEVPQGVKDYMSLDSKGFMQDTWKDVEPYLKKSPKNTTGYTHIASVECRSEEPVVESKEFDPDEIEAIAASALGPQPQTDECGNVYWYWKGLLHREDGPAIECASGTKEWYRNGQLHRDDGPARVWPDGTKWWFRNGRYHRDDGPAVEWYDGTKEWWRNGVHVEPFTESQFDPEEVEAIAFSIPPKWEFRWEDEAHMLVGIYFQGKKVGEYSIERKPTYAEQVKRSVEKRFKEYDAIKPYEYGVGWVNVWDWYWNVKNSLEDGVNR